MIDVLLYLEETGRSSFADWFDDLNEQAAAKVTIAVERLRNGNFSNIKSVGAGVQEFRINCGAGIPALFGPRRREAGDPPDRRHETTAG